MQSKNKQLTTGCTQSTHMQLENCEKDSTTTVQLLEIALSYTTCVRDLLYIDNEHPLE